LKAINIISFDVPFPANYGGIIDVFFKLKYFHSQGVDVHLHCFEYGRGEQQELNKYCSSVSYYKRKTGVFSFLSSLPYIVKSRSTEKLRDNLLKNDYPILFEGLHSCFLLSNHALKNRFKIVRNHNVEHDYYRSLASVETNFIKKHFFTSEAKKLRKFEAIIKNANCCLPISKTDLTYFQKKYDNIDFRLVTGFHQNEQVEVEPGKGEYVLYHGNLSVAENKNAVKFIVNHIFNDLEVPLKIAGLNPCQELIRLVRKYSNIELVQNPSDQEMNKLIRNAQINFLYTEQATGLKLKLLNALYNGRFSVVNSKMVEGTSLGNICIVEDNVEELKQLIKKTFTEEISNKEIEVRKVLLTEEYSNRNGYEKIILLL